MPNTLLYLAPWTPRQQRVLQRNRSVAADDPITDEERRVPAEGV
jgi:hypothetical protein